MEEIGRGGEGFRGKEFKKEGKLMAGDFEMRGCEIYNGRFVIFAKTNFAKWIFANWNFRKAFGISQSVQKLV